MSGVIVSVKGRYAVLLTKNSDFIKVKNKNYSVGDKVKIPQYKGQILATAASFIVVCGGISSYFVPAKYMSVDINPSVMMTINIYNRVINTKPLNDDAEILLSKTDVSGMSVSESMDELIKKSEEIGYLNEHNKDVIVEVVDGIGKIKLPDKNYGDVEVIIENADKADLKNAKEMGVSIAKARAIAEYTKQNGGSIEENVHKLENQSVKEIRRNLENKSEVKIESKTENKAEVKQESIPVQKSENKNISNSVQTLQPTVRAKNETVPTKEVQEVSRVTNVIQSKNIDTVSEKVNTLITEEKSNDTIFDNSVTKTLPDSIQEETKITDKPQVKNDTVPESEEPTVRPIHEDKYKSDNQCEIVVPSETVKPIKTTEPKQDEPKEEIKPQTSYGGHTTSGSRPNNSNQNQDKPSDNNTDKPNGDTEINPPIPDNGSKQPPQDNPNNQPPQPQNHDKPNDIYKDNTPPQPPRPNFDGGNEPPNKPYENPQPPPDNGNLSHEPNGGNNQSPDFNEPTGPNKSNDFGGSKNDIPPEQNAGNVFLPPPSEPHGNGEDSMPHFDGE